jgi:hypothetical protein
MAKKELAEKYFLSAPLEEGWDVSDIMLKVGQPKIISTHISEQTILM